MESVLNGKSLHIYILEFFEPKVWVKTLSRVSRVWRDVCRSDLLWMRIKAVIFKHLPSFTPPLNSNIYDGIKNIYLNYHQSQDMLSNLELCREMSLLNVDEYLLGSVRVDIMGNTRNRNVVVLYQNLAQNELIVQTIITTVKDTKRFIEPLRQLIRYGYVKHRDRTILWGNTIMNVMLIQELSQKRKRRKKK